MDQRTRSMLRAELSRDLEKVEQQIEGAAQEMNEVMVKLDALHSERDRLRDLQRYVAGREPEAAQAGRSPRVPRRTMDYIMQVLTLADEPQSVQTITKSIEHLGWTTDSTDPESVVRTTLQRMWERERVVRLGGGTYVLPSQKFRPEHGEGTSSAVPRVRTVRSRPLKGGDEIEKRKLQRLQDRATRPR